MDCIHNACPKWNYNDHQCEGGECILYGENKLVSEEDLDAVLDDNRKLKAEIDTLTDAIVWALGYTDKFRLRRIDEGAYWWRTELRTRCESSKELEKAIKVIEERTKHEL